MEKLLKRPKEVKKAWGKELIIENQDYCGKILVFNPNAKFSMHFHIEKDETWYVSKGNFTLNLIDTLNAERVSLNLQQGDVFYVPTGLPHQLCAGELGGEIFEVSKHHRDEDSYRVEKGDSQL